MRYELEPPYDPEFDYNPKFPFRVRIGPKVLSDLKEAEELGGRSRKQIVEHSMYFLEDATSYIREGYGLLGIELGKEEGEVITSGLLKSAITGIPDENWLAEYNRNLQASIMEGHEHAVFGLDIKSGKLLSRVEDRTGIDSFEAIIAQSIILYRTAMEKVANVGFLAARQPVSGKVIYLSDDFFDPVLDLSMKTNLIANIKKWRVNPLPNTA